MDPGEVLTREADGPDAVVRYAAHVDGLLDVHLPSGPGPHPVVLLVHGGFWKQAYDRRHTRPMSRALVSEGFVVAAPEYRRVGPGGAGGWPATAQDVDLVATRLPELLEGLGVATSTTTYVGHSAGGQLVLWLSGRGHRCDQVVALAPVADLRAAAREGLGSDATQALLGGTPEDVPERYDEADPRTVLAAVPDAGPELVVIHGVDDDEVPVEHSRALADAHPHVVLRELPGVDHYGLIDPESPAWPAVLVALRGEQAAPR